METHWDYEDCWLEIVGTKPEDVEAYKERELAKLNKAEENIQKKKQKLESEVAALEKKKLELNES